MLSNQCVILSGGPGAGKTTVLQTLQAQGHAVVKESARAIIHERRNQGLFPRPEPKPFASEVLRRDIANYRRALSELGWVFFDRGIPDGLCMLDQCTPLKQSKLNAVLSRYAYRRQVFLFPVWDEIYQNDADRDQTIDDARKVFGTLAAWYRRCSYEVVEVPKISTVERCAYILHRLERSAAVS